MDYMNGNIKEKNYKFLKEFDFIQFINPDETVFITTQDTFKVKTYLGHPHIPELDRTVVTNKRIIILTDNELYSIFFDEIQSIEQDSFLSIYSCDIIINISSRQIKILHIKYSIANEIVYHVNSYIHNKKTNEMTEESSTKINSFNK
jgi:hypothetical protein